MDKTEQCGGFSGVLQEVKILLNDGGSDVTRAFLFFGEEGVDLVLVTESGSGQARTCEAVDRFVSKTGLSCSIVPEGWATDDRLENALELKLWSVPYRGRSRDGFYESFGSSRVYPGDSSDIAMDK